MAEVKQNIPDGCLCTTLPQNRNAAEISMTDRCICLDRGGFFLDDVGSGLNCRRHPGFELAVEHTEEGRMIHNCPPCLKETT